MAVNISNTGVIDASFLLAFLFPDETKSIVEEVFTHYQNHQIHFIAPTLLKYEVLAAIRSSVLKKRISATIAHKLAKSFLEMDIEYHEISFESTLSLALEKNLTVYDASYLYLAKKEKITLFTLDSSLLK